VKLIVLKNNVPISDVLLETADPTEQYEFFIGRADDCHVFIDDPLISRHHLVIRNEGPIWYCEKLSQLGVVTINGSTATKASIFPGCEIRSGAYSIVVSDLQASEAPPHEVIPSKSSVPLFSTKSPSTEIPSAPVDDIAPLEILGNTTDLNSDELDIELADDLGEVLPENLTDELSSLDHNLGTEDSANDMDQSLVPDGFTQDEGLSEEYQDGQESVGEVSEFAEDVETQEEKTRVDQFFINYQLILFGEHAPYDKFQISHDEVFIGRDEKKCQIILNDPEVSSIHAVIRRSRMEMVLEDLNSSNGTILNGSRINRAQIGPGDEFVIGGTSFTLEVQSDLLEAEKGRLMPVAKNQVIEKEEIEEEIVDLENQDLDFDSAPVEKSLFKRFKKDPAFRKKAIYVIAGLGLLVVLFYEPESEVLPEPKAQSKTAGNANEKPKITLSKELETRRNVAYELGVGYFEESEYNKAEAEFKTVMEIDPSYKNIQSYYEQTKAGLKKLAELEAQRKEEEQRLATKKLVDELLVKAREATKEHQIELANSIFSQITEKDPENMEVQQLKLELESWQKEQERLALEKAAKEAARKAMVDALGSGKTFYLKKEWYRATLKLEEFLRKKGMDEDLVKEASDMLSDAKNQLATDLGPILGKARSLKEGQDLKNAYETYLEVLRLEPTNTEALNEVEDIRSQLDARSKKIYREAIIAESLSLFSDAKEKFQEVQQVSPTDSEYYKKASEKLRNYLE
jgi:pSer/pThr/pTyr-binding forkhead associated (FHA) protein